MPSTLLLTTQQQNWFSPSQNNGGLRGEYKRTLISLLLLFGLVMGLLPLIPGQIRLNSTRQGQITSSTAPSLRQSYPLLESYLAGTNAFKAVEGGWQPDLSSSVSAPAGLKPQEAQAWLAAGNHSSSTVNVPPAVQFGFPAQYNGTFTATKDKLKVSVVPVGASAASAVTEDNSLVYRNIYAQTDSVQTVDAGHSKEFLVLHNESAPKVFNYTLQTNGIARQEGEQVIVMGQGAGLSLTAPWLLDAQGVRHDGRDVLRWSVLAQGAGSYLLTLSIAASRLTYPLFVDPSWTTTGALTTARYNHTATLLTNGQVLVAGGLDSSGALASAELYNPSTGAWTTTGALTTARYQHTATLLANGQVLVAGGLDSSGALASAELYNPSTGVWTTTGALTTARANHTATLLTNGQVLVAGGQGSSSYLGSAELYNPLTGVWTSTGSLTTARANHTATLLANGQVLVAGGLDSSGYLGSAELYDPSTGVWTTTTGSLTAARYGHTATLLTNGQVLVAGGQGNSGAVASAELYNPLTGVWTTTTGALTTARYNHTATLLANGQVLVAGGSGSSTVLVSAELYNPSTGAWTTTGALTTARYRHTTTLLANGQVLVVGGYGNSGYLGSAELYDQSTGVWKTTGPLTNSRYQHTATLLANGQVLVVGGYSNGYLGSAELYDQSTGVWKTTGSLTTTREYHTATLLANGQVLVVGGSNGPILASAELYNPLTGVWTTTGSLTNSRYQHTATLLGNGQVLVAGGDGSLGSAELYDPSTGVWTSTGALTTARANHTATLLTNGQVLVASGRGGSVYLLSAELYNPLTGVWTTTGALTTARANHTATLLTNGQVLVAGGRGSSGYLLGAELYDPLTGVWTTTGALTNSRNQHTATLLANGQVLVAGGRVNSVYLGSAELYNPSTGAWTTTGSLTTARYNHTATLLANGQVLVAGGYNNGSLASAELYDVGLGYQNNWRPVVANMSPQSVILGSSFTLTGSNLTGLSEASGGSTNNSATNYPLVQLRQIDSGWIYWVTPSSTSTPSATTYTSATLDPTKISPGPALLTVFVNGIPSISYYVLILAVPTTTTLSSSLNPSPAGQAVTLTATVTSGSVTPTGSVTFYDAGVMIGTAQTLNASGVATLSQTFTSIGTHNLTAVYTSATGAYATSTGSLSQTVNPVPTAGLTLSGVPASATADSPFNFSVIAKDSNGNVATSYTGTVHFSSSDGQATLPFDYTFTTADTGVRTFSAALKRSGTQTLSVTDTANAALTDTSNVTVNAAKMSGFVISGLPALVSAGVSTNFTVSAVDAYGNTITAYTGTVGFTSSDPTASVTPSSYTFVVADNGQHTFSVTFNTLGTQTLTVKDQTTSTLQGTATTKVTNATLTSISVTPANPSIAKGTSQQFVATGAYSDGSTQDITSIVTWASATTTVATISNSAGSRGLATALATGTSQISATIGNTSGSTTLTVTAATLKSIAVTPVAPAIAKGTTQQFTATGTFSDGSTQDLSTQASWTSSNTAVATISAGGLASGLTAGSTTIIATFSGVNGTATLNVTSATLQSIVVTPPNPSIAKGTSRQFVATGTYSDGSTQDLTSIVTWSSSNTTVATISNTGGSNGLATGVSVGSTTITATGGSTSGSTTLMVMAAILKSIAVTPIAPAIAKGTTQQFTATGTFSDGSTQDLSTQASWTSSSTAVATINTAGLASGLTAGATTITATFSGVSGTATLNVTNATLQSLKVTPATATINALTNAQFTAIGTFSDGSTQDLTSSVVWTATNTAVATISNAPGSYGLATGRSVGTTTVVATFGTISGKATLTVTSALPASITASAGTPQSAPLNTAFAIALQAKVKDSAGNPLAGVNVTFSAPKSGPSGTFAGGSTTATVATDANGLAPAPQFTANNAPGNYNVTASVGSLSTTFALQNVVNGRSYYLPYYDAYMTDSHASDWLIVSNPNTTTTTVNISIGGQAIYSGAIQPGANYIQAFAPSTKGGPVIVSIAQGLPLIVSQRTLTNGNFEETPAILDSALAAHQYLPWFDTTFMQTVLYIANPNATKTATVNLTLAGVTFPGMPLQIAPLSVVTTTFVGQLNGPVELTSVSVGTSTPQPVVMTARSTYGTSNQFNEVVGTSASALSSDYLWTWWDSKITNNADWLLIGNPSANAVQVNVTIAGQAQQGFRVGAHSTAVQQYPGIMGGLVRVQAVQAGTTTPAQVFASQRTLTYGTFEEVPGTPTNSLNGEYYFTYYDSIINHGNDWILVANPSASQSVQVNVTVGTNGVSTQTVPPNSSAVFIYTSPEIQAGPVHIVATVQGTTTSAPVLVSQRVLQPNSAGQLEFNEVMGIRLQ